MLGKHKRSEQVLSMRGGWEFNDDRWMTSEDPTVDNGKREFGLSRKVPLLKKVVVAGGWRETAFCGWWDFTSDYGFGMNMGVGLMCKNVFNFLPKENV